MSDIISAWVDRDEMRRLAESLLSQPATNWSSRFEVDFGSEFEGFTESLSRDRDASEAPHNPLEREAKEHGAPLVQGPAFLKLAPIPKGNAGEPVDEVTGVPPLVKKAAVSSLKKAQVEGMAGGVIRSAEVARQESDPPKFSPPEPKTTLPENSRPSLISPFRRVSAPERASVPTAAANQCKLVRPARPSGDDPILTRVHHYGTWLKSSVGVRQFFISNLEGKILIDEVKNPKLIQVARSLTTASTKNSEKEGQVGSLHIRIGEASVLEVVPTPSQFGTLILGLIVERSLPEDVVREVRLGLQETADARLIRAQARRK